MAGPAKTDGREELCEALVKEGLLRGRSGGELDAEARTLFDEDGRGVDRPGYRARVLKGLKDGPGAPVVEGDRMRTCPPEEERLLEGGDRDPEEEEQRRQDEERDEDE